jgi:acetoin utilization transport system permease protein
MFHKALWMRNQKLAAPAIWAVYLSLFFFLPFFFFGEAQSLQTQVDEFHVKPSQLNFSFHGVQIALFMTLILVGFASLLIGLERTTHSTDLTFSLPFKRKDIFLSKWMFGAVHITTGLLVNLLLCMLIVRFTILNEIADASFLLEFMSLVIPFSIAIFTFSMFIGTIAGSMVSQFILSFIFLFFPVGFFSLIGTFLMFHGVDLEMLNGLNEGSLNTFGDFIATTTLPVTIFEFAYYTDVVDNIYGSVSNHTRMPSYLTLLSPLIYFAVTFPLGIWFFSCTKNENNGRLLVFEKGKRFFSFGVILCFALAFGMAGGNLFGSYNNPSLISYYFSASIGAVLSYFVLRKIMNIRLGLSK